MSSSGDHSKNIEFPSPVIPFIEQTNNTTWLYNVEQFVTGAPRVATAVVKLPLKLVVKPVLPVKTAEFKITLDTNKPPANLNEIFPGKSHK